MRRIALINQKGGVGKTTTAVNLGAALAEAGRRVVLVDLDPQANLTLHLGLRPEPGEPTSYRVLVGEVPFADAILSTDVPNLSVVPTDIDLSGAELELASAFGRETLLRDAVQAWQDAVAEGQALADYLLLDCPPSLGLLAINGLAAVDEVFLPVQTEFFALQGLSRLMETVALVRRRLHPTLRIGGIVACLYDSRLRLAREVLGEVRSHFPGQVFRQAIGMNVKLAEAPSFGQTILQYAPDSAGARDYRALAQEVLAQEERERAPDADTGATDGPTAATSEPAAARTHDRAATEPTGTVAGSDGAPEPLPADADGPAPRDAHAASPEPRQEIDLDAGDLTPVRRVDVRPPVS